MTYSLAISISSQDLNTIKQNGQRVVLVKDVECQSGDMPVAWSVFDPLTSNEVCWNPDFQVFASHSDPMPGLIINPISQAQIGFGQQIPYTTQGFGSPQSGSSVPVSSMAVTNQDTQDQKVTTGLSQQSTVNGMRLGSSPICALSLMKNLSVTLTPLEKIKVFLASNTRNGTVLGDIPHNACSVSYSNGNYSCSIRYDGASGRFVS